MLTAVLLSHLFHLRAHALCTNLRCQQAHRQEEESSHPNDARESFEIFLAFAMKSRDFS